MGWWGGCSDQCVLSDLSQEMREGAESPTPQVDDVFLKQATHKENSRLQRMLLGPKMKEQMHREGVIWGLGCMYDPGF